MSCQQRAHKVMTLPKPFALPMMEPPLTCLCHGGLQDGLAMCAYRSYYASTFILLYQGTILCIYIYTIHSLFHRGNMFHVHHILI